MFSVKQEVPIQENKVAHAHQHVDEHGFLINPDHWTVAFSEIALGLKSGELSIRQLSVIHFIRYKYLNFGALPPVRHVCKSTGVEKQELKIMFGTCMRLWRAAGLPSPNDEIRAHMN